MNQTDKTVAEVFKGEAFNKPDEERVEMASKIGHFIKEGEGAETTDMETAQSLAKLLTEDAVDEVRKAFADEVKSCSFLSPELANKIARDMSDISVPFLKETKSLENDALEAIVVDSHEEARAAIATREGLGENVSYAISVHGGAQSVQNLMENESAEISKRVCDKTLERFEDMPAVLNAMSGRDDLPLAILDDLIGKISEDIANKLIKSYDLGAEYASYIAGQTKFKARFSVLEKASEKEMDRFFRNLRHDGLLDDTTVIQVLQNIGTDAFKIALQVRSELSPFKVNKYLKEGTRDSIEKLFDAAKISKGLAGTMFKTYLRAVKHKK